MTEIDLPNTLTPPQEEDNIKPWGRLVSCLANLETVYVYKDYFLIGRSTSCDMHIDESKIALSIISNISKAHFALFKDPNNKNLYIKDLSKNGTFVNGLKIPKNENIIIKDKDKIAIGQKKIDVFMFRFVLNDDLPDTLTPLDKSNSPTVVYTVGQPVWGRLLSCFTYLASLDLCKPTFKVGRSSQCDFCIDETSLSVRIKQKFSKEHFLITKDDNTGIASITDLSKLGTFLNGHLIGKNKMQILQNEDTIGIGSTKTIYFYKSMYSSDINYLPPELKKKYEPSILLGRGGCGEVRLAYEKPFVINMREIVETPDEVFIVLDYMKGGELNNRILSNKPMTEENVKFLFYQIVLAVNFLHSNGIAHRDLKPENVLLFSDDVETLIKITDFGLSKVTDDDMMKTMCGTWHYIAPEVLDNRIPEYDKQVDIWSLGVILFYMLSRHLPFKSSDKEFLRTLILNGAYVMDDPSWNVITEIAKDLVKKMLTIEPQRRISIEEIITHPWISGDTLMQYRVKTMLQRSSGTNESDECNESDEHTTSVDSNSNEQSAKRFRLSISNKSEGCRLVLT